MNTIKLDHSAVNTQIHCKFTALAISLGYTPVADENSSSIKPEVILPQLYPFDIPKLVSVTLIEQDIPNIPKSDYCKKNLNDNNFPGMIPKPKRTLTGGFFLMDKSFESEEGIDAIKKLAEQTGHNLRPGTALELLLFWKKNRSVCPKYFVALGTVWNNKVLAWYSDCEEFDLIELVGLWNSKDQVFFVEDL